VAQHKEIKYIQIEVIIELEIGKTRENIELEEILLAEIIWTQLKGETVI